MGTTRAVPAADFPYRLTRVGVIMSPEDGNPLEVDGVLNPGSGRGPDGELYLLPRLVAGGQRLPDRPGQDQHGRRGADLGDPRGRGAGAGPELGAGRRSRRGRGPAGDLDRGPRRARDDLRRVRAAGAADGGGHLDRPAARGPGTGRCTSPTTTRWTATSTCSTTRTRSSSPSRSRAPDGTLSLAVLHRPMWDLDEIEPRPGPAAAGRAARSAGRHLDLLRAAGRGRRLISVALTGWQQHRFVAGPEFAFEELKIGGGPAPLRVPEGWLIIHHGVTGVLVRGVRPAEARELRRRRDDLGRGTAVGGRLPDLDPAAGARDRGRALGHRAQRRLSHRHRADRRRALRLLRHGRLQDRRGPDRRAVAIAAHPQPTRTFDDEATSRRVPLRFAAC